MRTSFKKFMLDTIKEVSVFKYKISWEAQKNYGVLHF